MLLITQLFYLFVLFASEVLLELNSFDLTSYFFLSIF